MADFSYAQRMDGITGSAIRDIFNLLKKPEIISFAGGMPAASSLQPDVIARLSQKALAREGTKILQYGATEGYAPLNEAVADFVKRVGITATPNQVLPTTGGQQAVDLVCKALINPDDVILVESPSFLGALQTMQLYQAKLVTMDTDEEGVIPERLEAQIKALRPKLIYIIPTFQNPTGRTLTLERRQKVAALAAKYRVAVLEDDPYRDLRYQGTALPSVKSFDEQGYIIYCMSFSKLISPGLRVAAVVCTDETLLRKLTICKQSTDVHSALLSQAIVNEFLREGLMPAHIEDICNSYRAQLNTMLQAFEKFPQGITHTNPEGGLFIWCALPSHMNAAKLLPQAVERGVAFIPGTHFYPMRGTNENTFRLNFSNATPEKIYKGMNILNEMITEAI